MKRTKVSWSNSVDVIEGPCIVCGKEVRYVVPDDRPNPSMLYHANCDMMPAIRENLKKANPPPLPSEYVIPRRVAPAPVVAAAPVVPPVTPA